ncbi:ATP-dependent DNA helicase PIF1-like protein [Tanacetum coccineum]
MGILSGRSIGARCSSKPASIPIVDLIGRLYERNASRNIRCHSNYGKKPGNFYRRIFYTENGNYLDFQDLPHPNPQVLTNMDNHLIREALDFDINKSKLEHKTLHPLLNHEQQLIYEQVIESVHNQRGQFYFVYGPGGTGKNFLYNTIIARLRTERKIVLAVASSSRTF